MILIDALYINGGGGKVLLDFLIQELEKTDKDVFYLIDERITGEIQSIKETNKLLFYKAGILSRRKFYCEYKDLFTSVLCFGNLPPEIRLKAKVYTYFHQHLYLEIPHDFSVKSKIMYKLKTRILYALRKNTDYWLVQSKYVQDRLADKYKVSNIKILPFYPPLPVSSTGERQENSYVYISNGTKHKNHINLIEAFCRFYDIEKKGKLLLTVSKDYPEIYEKIEEKKNQNYPIENIGFVKRSDLAVIYQSAEFIIYPSLSESFGLGLVEAIENGCKVIAADLPYTFAVCEPSLIFHPLHIPSIVQALSLSLQKNNNPSENKVKSNISEIISLLQ